MKHALTIICDENLASGLRLAGFDARGVTNVAACEDILLKSLDERHAEVVVVASELADDLPIETTESMAESQRPVFVSLPLTSNRGTDDVRAHVHNYVEELFRKTIGKNLAIPGAAE